MRPVTKKSSTHPATHHGSPGVRAVRLAFLLLLAAPAPGQQLHFDRLSLDEGLSQVSANVVLQDRTGYVWIGTQDGLNRFDGYDVVVYRRDPARTDSLAGNFIQSLYEDRDARLWIVSQPGNLTRFDPASGRFRRFVHDPEDPRSLASGNVANGVFYEDAAGVLWVAVAGQGVDRIADDGSVTHLAAEPGRDPSFTPSFAQRTLAILPGRFVSAILEDRSGSVWVATFDGGLGRRVTSATGERFVIYRRRDEDAAGLASDSVTSLYEDRAGNLLVGTWGGGLYRFDAQREVFHRFAHPAGIDDAASHANFIVPAGLPHLSSIVEDRAGNLWAVTRSGVIRWHPDRRRFRHYQNRPDDPASLSNNAVTSLYADSAGAVWIGTAQGGGLNRYDPARDAFERYVKDPADPRSLSSNVVLTLYEDRSGLLWIGTVNGGASRFSRQKHQFRHYRRRADAPRELADNMVFTIAEDGDGTLWIGTLDGGVYHLDARRQEVVARYFADPGVGPTGVRPTGGRRDVGANQVRALHADERGGLWVGTQGGGLSRIDPGSGDVTGRWTNDPQDATSLSNNGVNGIDQDSAGDLWIATNFGWNRFDRDAGTFERYFNDPASPRSLPGNFIRLTYEDRAGNLWVGGTVGFGRFDRATKNFTNYAHDPGDPESLANDNVMALYDDGEGGLWVATYGGGLDRLEEATGKFTHFTRQDGLPSASLYSLLPDADGRLWISSNHGLTRFDPRTATFTNYDRGDGLQANEFNGRSYLVTADGEMLFGGVNGITAFYPEEIRPSSYAPPVVLTAFKKFDRPVAFDRPLDELERLDLSYRDRFFGFEFAALDYNNPAKNRYAYQLEGFDDDWVESGTRRYATYTNLDGGTYVFRVRATNCDGVWSEEEASIEVVVVPPPWKTWWAYALYGLAAAAVLFGYLRFKTRRHRAEMRLQRAETERQRLLAARLQQIDVMKDEFLANTSHELRTPLNGIIGIAESLLDGATGELAPSTRANLFMVASSGRRLAHLVDDILDFSKLKNREIELRKRAVSLRELVEIVLTLSRPLVADRDLALVNRVPEDLPRVLGDENRLQQILHNLVGNAIKFTEEGSVAVEAAARDGIVEVTVTDTGIGIPGDKLERIFEGFEQADASTGREYGGTGLGLTITRQLVELHGGEIRAESAVGEGSRFVVTLPAAGGEAEAAPSDATQQLARLRHRLADEPEPGSQARRVTAAGGDGDGSGAGSGDLEDLHVLVVDDEPINLQVMHNILSLARFQVAQAQDGPQALELLAGGYVPDVVLLDVMMPRMTGFEVARRLRRQYSANDLPIILVTAKNQVSDLMEGLASGANDYLTKPFSKDELLARIRTHVSLSKAHSIEAENRRRTEELEQARAIQLSMLPGAPPEVGYLEIAAYMKTATEVGGDYYDFFPQADGSLYVVTGDATGHGISAGMMVSMTKSALKALEVQSPHTLLRQMNRVFREVHLQRMKMALNVAYVNDSEIALASAAMPPVFHFRAATGEVSEILVSSLPLGSLRELHFPLEVFAFRPGDALLMLSDGLSETRNGDERPLGYEAVERCLAAHAAEPAAEILRALVELGERWAGGDRPLDDDVTVVVLKRR